MAKPILIIGAGITGITCARALACAGHPVRVVDKGRGIGGRLATRRVGEDMAFDHGAQYFSARSAAFDEVLREAEAAGAIARWPEGDPDHATYVGTPGMNALIKHMASALTVSQQVEITAIRDSGDGWITEYTGGSIEAPHLVSTVPVIQARTLLGHVPGIGEALAPVKVAPCWALMITFESPPAAIPERILPKTGPIAWVARNSAKPGRPDAECWVAHATPEWSATNLEIDRETIADRLTEALAEVFGGALPPIRHVAAHRWRYANTVAPLGRPFLLGRNLHIGGDWCLGARVRHGFESGLAIAQDILAQS